jgi:chromosome segregation ATPase
MTLEEQARTQGEPTPEEQFDPTLDKAKGVMSEYRRLKAAEENAQSRISEAETARADAEAAKTQAEADLATRTTELEGQYQGQIASANSRAEAAEAKVRGYEADAEARDIAVGRLKREHKKFFNQRNKYRTRALTAEERVAELETEIADAKKEASEAERQLDNYKRTHTVSDADHQAVVAEKEKLGKAKAGYEKLLGEIDIVITDEE